MQMSVKHSVSSQDWEIYLSGEIPAVETSYFATKNLY